MPLFACILLGALLPSSSKGLLLALKPVMACGGAVFLFVSALELDLKGVRGEFRLVSRLALGAFIPPLLLGLGLGLGLPGLFPGMEGVPVFKSAMVLAIAMSVSAVPVILKILQEMGALATPLGRRVVLTATLCDLTAWLLFFPLLPGSRQASWGLSHLTLLSFFLGLWLTYRHPGFLERRRWLRFVSGWVAAPLFFIGIGSNLDFSHGLNLPQIAVVFFAASFSKILGVLAAFRGTSISGPERRIMALALNARGAMEILMAGLALQAGLLNRDLFLSLVVMAVGTSLVVKPVLGLGGISKGYLIKELERRESLADIGSPRG